MEAGRRYTVLDVFADEPLAGNALAVVHDAEGLDDQTMLRFARETRLSETTFVQPPTEPGADYLNRIFTIGGEVPFAGHPSLGTAVAVARARGEREARYVQQTGAGLQPVEVKCSEGGEGAYASVLQEPAVLGPEVDAAEALVTVGLELAVAAPSLPPQVVSTGLAHLLVPVAEAGALARAVPAPAELAGLLERIGAAALYLFHHEPGAERARARMFSSLVGGGEDPATGSAAGPLCAYLAERAGVRRLEIVQGVEIERPSRLVAEVEGDRVRVGGGVVTVVDGTVYL